MMDIEDLTVRSRTRRRNNPSLPSSLHTLIVGRSNCGKTVLLLNLLLKGWLDYDNLLVFGNSLHQQEYQILKRGFEKGLSKGQILNLFHNQDDMPPLEAIEAYNGHRGGGVTASFYEDCDAIPDPKSLDPDKKSLIILDDYYLGKQSKAGAYYSRGRHNNCDSIYITQNYFALPRHSVRENANIIMLFKQNQKSVHHIHQDHCTELPFQEFDKICANIWSVKHDFLTIDLSGGCKYRKNLDKSITGGGGGSLVLPGNIKGLKERFQLVCAERAAGNVDATTPEIVGILDELLRRGELTREEYNAVCKELQC